jgi:hypothetical protein
MNQDVHGALHTELNSIGFNLNPFLNENWVKKMTAMPEGVAKKAEITRVARMLANSVKAIENGDFELVEFIDEELTTDPIKLKKEHAN